MTFIRERKVVSLRSRVIENDRTDDWGRVGDSILRLTFWYFTVDVDLAVARRGSGADKVAAGPPHPREHRGQGVSHVIRSGILSFPGIPTECVLAKNMGPPGQGFLVSGWWRRAWGIGRRAGSHLDSHVSKLVWERLSSSLDHRPKIIFHAFARSCFFSTRSPRVPLFPSNIPIPAEESCI